MPKADWATRFANWFGWYKSGAGPYFNNGDPVNYPYYIKNFYWVGQPSYAHDSSVQLTLSEGQSYGMLYALLADDLKAFQGVYEVLNARHKLTQANIQASKGFVMNGEPGWSAEYPDFMDNTGKFVLENKGANPTINLFGWIWSQNYNPSTPAYEGLASIYDAPDGSVVAAACLLMAADRWNLTEYRTTALEILADLAQYGVRKCGSRYALTMGQYRGAGGTVLPQTPVTISLSGSTVYPGSDQILLDLTGITTGDAIRFWVPSGSTLCGGLTGQDTTGAAWPKYYVRVIDPYKGEFYPTKADAVAGTNIVDITTTGSGDVYAYVYETQAGMVAVNPSYQFAPFFRMFAQYDTANAALWTSLSDNSYVDIAHSCTLNYWNMPTYLDGVNIADGSNAFFPSGGDSASHNADATRVALNLAFDGSDAALTALKTQCQFNGTTGLWEPKADNAGGIWRFWLDSGFIPFTMSANSYVYDYDASTANAGADTVDLGQGWVADAGSYTQPIRFSTSGFPVGCSGDVAYFPRLSSGTTYTLHPTRADALANTNKINITAAGSAGQQWTLGIALSAVNATTNAFTLADEGSAFKTGMPIRIVPQASGGSNPGGVTAATTYYGRLTAKNTFTLHDTAAHAIANTNVVDVTSAGSGEVVLTKPCADVQWFWRGAIGGTTEISPYGAAQIMAYKYALNGYADAETFYNSLPSWARQQGDGSFVESNGDYYVQHFLGWMSAIMGGQANARYRGRAYSVFTSAQLTDATALQTQIASALGVSVYGTVLVDDASGKYAVPIIGDVAFAALTPTQQNATVRVLPSGSWRANA